MENLIILGAGENGVMAKNIIDEDNSLSNKYNVIGFLDDDRSKIGAEICGKKVLGNMKEWNQYDDAYFTSPFVVSPKSNYLKLKVLKKLKIPRDKFVNLISSETYLPKDLIFEKGNFIVSGVQFQSNVKIGSHIYISNNSVICSNTIIENYVNISNSAAIQGGVLIKEGAYIGANSSIIGHEKIGKYSIIGMGSVVINEVKDFEIVVGNPARPIGINKSAIEYFKK